MSAKSCSESFEIDTRAGEDSTVTRITGEDGEAVLTCFSVFPGIDLIYNDVHAARCPVRRHDGQLQIRHCREGRVEFPRGDDFFYLAPGDLAVMMSDALPDEAHFPMGHYHGITVSIDPAHAPVCLSCFLEDVNVRPDALAEKFCAQGRCFAARSSARVEHVFSELYSVPERIRRGYFKVKILELVLFLSELPVQEEPMRSLPRAQAALARRVCAYLTEHTESRVTSEELCARFGASESLIRTSFQGVYGLSPAAFLRAQKMHGAAELLRGTDRTVLDIAGQFGYDNPSKFARTFRDVIGVSPNEYRSGVDRDSCAP